MDIFTDHPSDEGLETYSLRNLSAPETDGLEEHLLLCEACQIRLQDTDVFVSSTKEAARRLREEDRVSR